MKKQPDHRYYFIGATNFGFMKAYYDNDLFELFKKLSQDGFIDDRLFVQQVGRSIEEDMLSIDLSEDEIIDLIKTVTMFSFVEFEDTSHYLYNVVTVREASELLGMSEQEVWDSCEIGRFTARQADENMWLIDKKSLQPLMMKQSNQKGLSAN